MTARKGRRPKSQRGMQLTPEAAKAIAEKKHAARRALEEAARVVRSPEERLEALRESLWRVLELSGMEKQAKKLLMRDPRKYWDVLQGTLPKMDKVKEGAKTAEEVVAEALGEAPGELERWAAERKRNAAMTAAQPQANGAVGT